MVGRTVGRLSKVFPNLPKAFPNPSSATPQYPRAQNDNCDHFSSDNDSDNHGNANNDGDNQKNVVFYHFSSDNDREKKTTQKTADNDVSSDFLGDLYTAVHD